MKNSGHTSTDRPEQIFRDRREAGRVLGELLEAYRGDPRVVVLGLARGGVPVAWEVAAAWVQPSMPSSYASSGFPAARSSRWGHWRVAAWWS